MPLLKKLLLSRELDIERQNSRASKPSNFANCEYDGDSNLDGKMETSVMNSPVPKKKSGVVKAPTIPQRNSKRTSTILNNVVPAKECMNGFEDAKEVVKEETSEISDPHELYLSSEEDASLSDTDSLLDFKAAPVLECNDPRSSSRASAEDTARVVSFTLVSRPRVIEIPRPTSLHLDSTSRTDSLVADYQIRHSVADIASLAPIPSAHPPRLSSRQNSPHRNPASRLSIYSLGINTSQVNLSTVNLPLQSSKSNSNTTFLQPHSAASHSSPQHAFLSSDPFPSPTPSCLSENPPFLPEPEHDVQSRRPKSMHSERPKTPTSFMEGLQGLTRTLTKSTKKRPSMPKLNSSHTSVDAIHVNTSQSSLVDSNASKTSLLTVDEKPPKEGKVGSLRRSSALSLYVQEEGEKEKRGQETPTTPSAIDGNPPVRYEDIMKNVIREPPPKAPITSQSSPGLKGWMGMGVANRRKSVLMTKK